MKGNTKLEFPKWSREDGSLVSCTEKVKVMTENFDEIIQIIQDAFEDGILMEVSEDQMKATLHAIIDNLANPYVKNDPNYSDK